MLMALVKASRSSELAALDLRFRTFNQEGVLFRLASLTKKRSPGAPPRELLFGGYPEDENLCVVQCLRSYEKATLEFRIQPPSVENKLFLSYVRPHKPVTSQRIAHWLKMTLDLSGIDTKTFSAHSTRGASTSAALAKGVSMAEILQTADWSGESTFRTFYHRPCRDMSYAQKVLAAD